MKRISLRRKTRFGSSKGVSTVIATIFLVLTVFVLSTNVFLWSLSQNALYNKAVKERNQQDVDRLIENIIATNTTLVPSTGTFSVKTEIVNGGSITAQIVTLWVLDATQRKYNVTDLRASNINLNPGERQTFSKTVQIPGASPTDSFSAWFVTARGNTVPLTESQGIIIAQVAQGIGSFAMDFGSFVYYHVDLVSGKYRLRQSEWPNGLSGFTVQSRQNIAFRVTLTNYDANKRTIALTSHSVLWMLFPASEQQPRGAWWYVVNVDANGIIAATFTTVNIPYGTQAQVFFASSVDNSFSPSSIGNPISPNQPAAVNLMLIGMISSADFGQNIPFVSVYVT